MLFSIGYIRVFCLSVSLQGFADGSAVKNLPAKQETQIQSLGQKDPLEKEKATHSSTLAMDRGAWQATVREVAKSWT